MPDVSDLQSVINVAREKREPTVLMSTPHRQWLHTDKGVTEVDTSAAQPTPARKSGVVQVFDAASFNKIVSDNLTAGAATIYVDRDVNAPKIVAVLNGNGAVGPGWGDHRVSLVFRPTPQWMKWKARDGKMTLQAEFAEFIEDNLLDVAEPAGGALLEIVTYLQATRTVDFKSAIRLSSGQIQFANIESIDAKVSASAIAVPETFKLALAPFFGLPPYAVPARFRYRLSDGKLTLGFKLQRVEDMMEAIISDVVAAILVPEGVTMVDGVAP